ncbi:MAG: hypothetical protein J2P16_02850 [Mycobacterium sp.]|nr:hypothetical protein [Mycobacterium sp.]
MIPLPRAWALASAMLVGVGVGTVAGTAATLLVHARVRSDIVIALVVGLPTAAGLLIILTSRRRWVTALGAFLVALASGWFGVLALIEVMTPAR